MLWGQKVLEVSAHSISSPRLTPRRKKCPGTNEGNPDCQNVLPGLSKSSTFVIKILFLFFSIYYYCLKSIKVFYLPFTLFFFLSQSKSLKLRNYIGIEALLLFKRELYVIWIKYSNPLKTQMTKILIAFCQYIYQYIYIHI